MKQITVVVTGDSGSGKTSVIKSVTEQSFRTDIGLTIGVDYARIKDENIEIQVWDTAGMEKFASLTTSYYRSADVILIVYDVSVPDSYENVWNKWIPLITRFTNDVHIIVVGNKSDKSDNTYPEIQDTKHFRVSAKEMNCRCIFDYIKQLYAEKEHRNDTIKLSKFLAKKTKCY